MKKIFFIFALCSVATFISCSKTETVTVTVDSALPQGNFTKSRMGTLMAENGTPTAGVVTIGTDEKGTSFLKMATDFKTELATGTVTVYFSKTKALAFDPGKGNPNVKLVGVVAKNGEQFIKLNSTIPTEFSFLVLYCATANINFGNAPLN